MTMTIYPTRLTFKPSAIYREDDQFKTTIYYMFYLPANLLLSSLLS